MVKAEAVSIYSAAIEDSVYSVRTASVVSAEVPDLVTKGLQKESLFSSLVLSVSIRREVDVRAAVLAVLAVLANCAVAALTEREVLLRKQLVLRL